MRSLPARDWFWRTLGRGHLVVLVLLGSIPGCDDRGKQPVKAERRSVTVEAGIEAARRQFAAKNWDAALRSAEAVLQSDADYVPALLIAGEAATRLERYREALGYYRRVPLSPAAENLSATMAAAEIQRVFGSLDQAEALYRRVLSVAPQHRLALEQLATVLKLTGRPREAQQLLLQLLAMGAGQPQQLRWLADPTHPLQARELLERSLRAAPDQRFARLGLAEADWVVGEIAVARRQLSELRTRPLQHPEIEALYARCLLADNDRPALEQWSQELTDAVREQADLWHLTGRLCELRGQPQAACRCQLECVSRDPDHAAAAHRAGRLLTELRHPEQARPLLLQGERLTELATLADRVRPESPDAALWRTIAERLEALGRPWEAYGWTALVARLPDGDPQWVAAMDQRLRPHVQSSTPFARPAVLDDLTDFAARFPLPDRSSGPPVESPTATLRTELSFRDVAREVGIDFTYFDDHDSSSEGRRMPEFTGGGVAVLDYDLDGWPDLYFTQGARLEAVDRTAEHLDPLFRNGGDGRFQNVTTASRIREAGYSQGVSAGDFNNDGFPDLYVANLGQNRLFENRGDGTFVEAPLPESSAWTTSCAIADLNCDGIPDLYDVNYVTGPELLTRRCPTPAGLRVCAPYAFSADPDRLLLGMGDGSFRDVTATAEINPPGGKGLGLLIGPLSDGDSPTDVFVANDTEANFLLVNRQPPGQPPVFTDHGTVSGVAFDHDGKPQACMGIAAADFDHNGQLDLFVTNYFNESNALYLGLSPGLFDEASQRSGLRVPSLPMLGFGTQAIDADRDGHFDLVVANGDLDDFTHETGRQFRMRPQLFLNNGRAQFTERVATAPGDYFAAESAHRGRGLAWLDWNRDGRADFVVSHLDEPAALVTNQTETEGGFVALRFIGTASSRDAIGTRICLFAEATPERSQFAWLTGGDGYQSSNERGVLLGVGDQTGPFAAEVTWPSGKAETLRALRRNGAFVCIEGVKIPMVDALRRK